MNSQATESESTETREEIRKRLREQIKDLKKERMTPPIILRPRFATRFPTLLKDVRSMVAKEHDLFWAAGMDLLPPQID